MLRDIGRAVDVKRKVESILCPVCQGAKLTFYSVAFDDGFEFKKGESMVVDAHCTACEGEPTLILVIRADGHLD